MRTNYPKNDKYTLYISEHAFYDLAGMIDAIKLHFGDDMIIGDYNITLEHRHTNCIGYDLYDPGDYTNYAIIETKAGTYIEYDGKKYRPGENIKINTENSNITLGKSYKIEKVLKNNDSIIIIDDNGEEFELSAMFIEG